MNILRLSLFKLKKNKKEAVAIVFLTMITTLMLSVFAANISKANKAYYDSFAQAGSKDTCVMIRKDKFRDEYRNLLEDDYGITDITEAESIFASLLDYRNNIGEDRTYQSIFVTEKNERKIEDFVKNDKLTDEEIEKLEEQCELMDFYTQKRDMDKILSMNSTFHDIIYNSAGSRFLAQVLRSYKGYLDKTRKSVFYEESFLDRIQEEHRAIFEAVKARDTERALEAIRAHLSASRERTEAVWNIK